MTQTATPQPSRPDDGYVDPVAVARALDGDRTVPLSRAERAAFAHRLTDAGHSVGQIAYRLGTSNRTVRRLLDTFVPPEPAGSPT